MPADIQKIIEEDADKQVDLEADVEYKNQQAGVRFAKEIKPDFKTLYLSDEEVARWVKALEPVIEPKLEEVEGLGFAAREVHADLLERADKYNKLYPPMKWD